MAMAIVSIGTAHLVSTAAANDSQTHLTSNRNQSVRISANNKSLREERSHGVQSLSRRESLLHGASAFVGVSGLNLLCTPRIGATESKQKNLSIEELQKIIEDDITQRKYLVTGNLTESIYDDNFRFKDPVTELRGLEKYIGGLQSLFEDSAKLELLSTGITGPRSVQMVWRLQGYMKFPWHPYIPPYEGTTKYTFDERGLIVSISETWNISPLTGFLEFITPSWRT